MHSTKKAARAAAIGLAVVLGSVSATTLPAVAQSATEQTFDIAAQPLGLALIRFSDATGIQLFDASLTRGLQSPGAPSRALAPSEALSRLLAGSGAHLPLHQPHHDHARARACAAAGIRRAERGRDDAGAGGRRT